MIPQLSVAMADRYQIERELGQGGMATVYLAHDLRHDRKVALKVLRPELAAVLGPERFLNEIRITAGLDHPHIVTLIDSGTTDGFLWYVLPFIRGESLRDRLDREQQLGVEEALTIARQIAGALHFAHQHGVIHRDVKPQNILLHEGEALLADFGIALAVREAGGNRLTETGISLGTPEYMSPEQAGGARTLDQRSDIYSLGAVLYEMLAGEPPLTGPTAHAVIAKLMTERPTRLHVLRDTVPDGIDAAVARALAKVPADRFSSAAEFAGALSDGSGAGRSLSRASSRIRRILPWGAAAAVGVVLIAWAVLHRSPPRVIQPDRVQLTSTGNARTPALTADGKRLAYTSHQCDAEGHCTTDVVVQDVSGAGSATILTGWASVWDIEWTGDGRYLLVHGLQGPGRPRGLFGVPALGGEPRLLGSVASDGGAMVGSSDTVLTYRQIAGDSLIWLRWITITDGLTRDSLPVRRRLGTEYRIWPFPDGRHLMLFRPGPPGFTATVMDRMGRVGDSLLVDTPLQVGIGLTRDGRMLLVGSVPSVPAEDYDLLAYRVSPTGRISTQPDTVLRQVRGDVTSASNGMLLLADGPAQREVWTMRREGSPGLRFTQRRLTTATTDLSGLVSPAGDQILLVRSVLQGDRVSTQLSVVPFDGGPETPLNSPADAVGGLWGWDGKSVFTLRLQKDSLDIGEIDLASSRSRHFLTIWTGSMAGSPHVLQGGGMTLSLKQPAGLRGVGIPGLRDTTFPMPEIKNGSVVVATSPDGRAAAWIAFDPNGDSLRLDRVSLRDGSVKRLLAFRASGAAETFWLSDGTLLLQINEADGMLSWYRLPATGGTLVRLGSPPRYPAVYNMSLDGRHIVASLREDRPDIYLIRNFADLWRR